MNKEEINNKLKENEKEFLKNKPDFFHLVMLKYVAKHEDYDASGQLEDIMENNHVLSFDFPDGTWTIKWNDLVERAEKELEIFQQEHPDIEFDDFYNMQEKNSNQ
jgi:hypothetical protein